MTAIQKPYATPTIPEVIPTQDQHIWYNTKKDVFLFSDEAEGIDNGEYASKAEAKAALAAYVAHL